MGETELRKWYRVIDPLSPLYGCDVRGNYRNATFGPEHGLIIDGLRRIDILIGDRPFQLMAPAGEDIGLIIRLSNLELSPLQDDVIELATDSPYGNCVSDVQISREDRAVLHVVSYERAYQVALLRNGSNPTKIVASRIIRCEPHVILKITKAFENGTDIDMMRDFIKGA